MFRYRSTPAKCIVRINAAGYSYTRPRLFFVRCYTGKQSFIVEGAFQQSRVVWNAPPILILGLQVE